MELNETSGRINGLVNAGPGYSATVAPFEKVAAGTPDEQYDAIVTNVPFGGVADRGGNQLHDNRYQKEPLQNYFILRSLEKLKPGGLAWISEPVYAGNLNEVFKLFHDEKVVREAAFAAVCKAVDDGRLLLEKELFFNTRSFFENFEQFEQRMIRVTHSNHQLSPELFEQVREKFDSFLTPEGATFLNPQRVDLLRKPA